MKNFTEINNNLKNNLSEKNVNVEIELKNLIESLSIEIESEDKLWEKSFEIKADKKFYENLKTIINKIYQKEKLKLLEKIKLSILNRDISWVDDEIENVYKSLK